MNAQKRLKFFNIFLALDFVCLVISALLDDVLPHKVFGVVHPALGMLLLVLVVVHLILNRGWVKTQFFRK